jgi:hypothetical protein
MLPAVHVVVQFYLVWNSIYMSHKPQTYVYFIYTHVYGCIYTHTHI